MGTKPSPSLLKRSWQFFLGEKPQLLRSSTPKPNSASYVIRFSSQTPLTAEEKVFALKMLAAIGIQENDVDFSVGPTPFTTSTKSVSIGSVQDPEKNIEIPHPQEILADSKLKIIAWNQLKILAFNMGLKIPRKN